MELNGQFEARFGRAAQVQAAAPGRVNLIGEHTDYNDGFVLPSAIAQTTRVLLARNGSTEVRAYALDLDEPASYALGREARTGTWVDYLQGVTQELARDGLKLEGFDVLVSSDVPHGAGLSSSAALLVATLRGLRDLLGLPLTDVQVALLARRAENGLVGANVGIMDQMACSLAQPGEALFLDCRSLEFERLPLPAELEVVVLHSGVTHQHVGGEYNTRRAECARACELLGVGSLRELTLADLPRVEALPDPVSRRARHVLTENERVLQTVRALREGDFGRAGQLFVESHASMRDDYQITVPEIDLIVELAVGHPDVLGARMTGGGFGGSVVILVRFGKGRAAGEAVAAEYARRSGQEPKLLSPEPANRSG